MLPRVIWARCTVNFANALSRARALQVGASRPTPRPHSYLSKGAGFGQN